MKNIFFLLFILAGYTATSQLNKGDLYLGGSLGMSSSKNNNNNTQPAPYSENSSSTNNNLNLSPRIAYFLKDKLAIGVGLNSNYNKYENLYDYYSYGVHSQSNDNQSKNFTYSFRPFIRQYFSLGSSVAIFINANAFIGLGNSKSSTHTATTDPNDGTISITDGNSKSKSTNWGAGITPGFAFFPSKKWSIEFSFASVGYNASKVKETKSKDHSFGLSYGVATFNVGVSYYLRSN